jgi:hypothetical protein
MELELREPVEPRQEWDTASEQNRNNADFHSVDESELE